MADGGSEACILTTIQFRPLAAESLGVRSMAVFIQTPDVRLLIDPGVSLGRRWGLLPHPQEYRRLLACREAILHYADRCEVIAVSHYHFDHCPPSFVDAVWTLSSPDEATRIVQDKVVLAKDGRSHVHAGQRRRGWLFKKLLGASAKDFQIADDRVFTFGATTITFSPPVPHGEENTPLGWVLMTQVDCEGERVLHASDVQGPMRDATLRLILATHPHLVYVGGPPLYLADFRVDRAVIERGLTNLATLAATTPTVLVDHHLLRDEAWRDASTSVFQAAQSQGHRVVTAAEFRGQEDQLLESKRRHLYEADPPSNEFLKWTRLSREKRRTVQPPL